MFAGSSRDRRNLKQAINLRTARICLITDGIYWLNSLTVKIFTPCGTVIPSIGGNYVPLSIPTTLFGSFFFSLSLSYSVVSRII